MELIRKLGTRKTKNSVSSWGLFLSKYCETEVERQLNSGKHCKSCGCMHDILSVEHQFQHGDGSKKSIYHDLYECWSNMNRRCYNRKNIAFKRYGGRGIRVCERWRHNYLAFKIDLLKMGWEKGLTIDRANNDDIYEPSNCRVITKAENSDNTSKTKLTWDKVNYIRELYSTKLYSKALFGKNISS